MLNVGKFFALAREQLQRYNDGRTTDAVLADVCSRYYHPTAPSRVARIASTLPREQIPRFVVACHYFGAEQPDLVLPIFLCDDGMEARARLVDAGAVTAPDSAPCRTWPWAFMALFMNMSGVLTTRRFYQLTEDRFGKSANAVLADARQALPEPEDGMFLPLSPEAIRGLGWVADGDSSNPDARDTARLAVHYLLGAQGQHWPSFGTECWTPDRIVAWAEIMFAYLSDVRRGAA